MDAWKVVLEKTPKFRVFSSAALVRNAERRVKPTAGRRTPAGPGQRAVTFSQTDCMSRRTNLMKGLAFLLFLAGCLVPVVSAQEEEHVQVGVFADYFRLAQTDNNFGGVGALVSFAGL
jgi:hypothetical protein